MTDNRFASRDECSLAFGAREHSSCEIDKCDADAMEVARRSGRAVETARRHVDDRSPQRCLDVGKEEVARVLGRRWPDARPDRALDNEHVGTVYAVAVGCAPLRRPRRLASHRCSVLDRENLVESGDCECFRRNRLDRAPRERTVLLRRRVLDAEHHGHAR
jgi:hypothetical protein